MQILISHICFENSNITWFVIIIVCIVLLAAIYIILKKRIKNGVKMENMLSLLLMMNYIALIVIIMCLSCYWLFEKPKQEIVNDKAKHHMERLTLNPDSLQKLETPLLDPLPYNSQKDSLDSDSTTIEELTVLGKTKIIPQNLMRSISFINNQHPLFLIKRDDSIKLHCR